MLQEHTTALSLQCFRNFQIIVCFSTKPRHAQSLIAAWFPDQGSNPGLLRREQGVSAPGPPGKPLTFLLLSLSLHHCQRMQSVPYRFFEICRVSFCGSRSSPPPAFDVWLLTASKLHSLLFPSGLRAAQNDRRAWLPLLSCWWEM